MSKPPASASLNNRIRPHGQDASASEPQITYGHLIEYHITKLKTDFNDRTGQHGTNGNGNSSASNESKKEIQTVLNHMTAINDWMDDKGLDEGTVIGHEFNAQFKSELESHVSYLRKKTHQHKGEEIIGLADSTISNRVTLLGLWQRSWSDIEKKNNLPKVLSKALLYLVDRANLNLHAYNNAVGLPQNTLHTWTTGGRLPSEEGLAHLKTIERYEELEPGALTSLVKVTRRTPKAGAGGEIATTDYGKRQRRYIQETYYLDEFPPRLEAEWREFYALMTPLLDPRGPIKRNKSWHVNEKTGKCPSGLKFYKKLCSFFGYLCLPKRGKRFEITAVVDGERKVVDHSLLKGQGLKRSDLTLALLGNVEYVKAYNEFMRKRAGNFNSDTRNMLEMCLQLLRRETGFVRQHPEYGMRLNPQVPIKKWDQWCDTSREEIRATIKEIKKKKLIKQSRNVNEPIQFILNSPHPMHYLFKLADLMEADLPIDPARDARAVAYRNLFLVRFLTSNPLRIGQFTMMTYNEGNTGNLFQDYDNSWWLRFPKEAFKNRDSLEVDYLAEISPTLWPYIETYLFEHRPQLFGADKCDLVFRPSHSGREDLNDDEGAVLPLYENSLSSMLRAAARHHLHCLGFGSHAYRHIIATDYIKNDVNGIEVAARILHDKPETVRKAYKHLLHADYFKHWIKYHDAQRKAFSL